MAKITLENMQFYSFHGCYEQEQQVGGRFRVDLEYEVDTTVAERSDFIGDTVSYLDVYELVRSEMTVTSHVLEHVSRRIVDALISRFPTIFSVKVKVVKLSPPLGGPLTGVGVELFEERINR